MSEAPDFDVVVVGGGIAGLTAASRAAQHGLKVALLERGRDERYLCNTRYSGGIIHLAFRNVKDQPEELAEAIRAATLGHADAALVTALATTCGRAADWLQQEGAKFIRVGQINWQQWVLAPPRPLVGGLDWKGRGPDVTLRVLTRNFVQRGGVLFRGASAQALMERDGACIGVEALTDSGVRQFGARAVVLADGGFQGNPNLVALHVCLAPAKLKQRGASTGIGDGLRMASELGARLTELGYFYGHVLAREAFTNDRVWPYPQLDELATAGIAVNAAGERCIDEGRGGVFVANAIAKLADPLSMWAVFDAAIWEGPGRAARIPANPNLVNAGATVYKAGSVPELAAFMGMPAHALAATIDEYNQALSAGRLAQLPAPRTAATVAPMPILRAPFYAVALCAGITYTFGGIATDGHGRVMGSNGNPVGGLYAAGATTGGLEGGAGCGYVGGLVKGVVFGLRAAEHIVQVLKP